MVGVGFEPRRSEDVAPNDFLTFRDILEFL